MNDPADFGREAIAGFVAANAGLVRGVHGGVARSVAATDRQVALVVGGGSGHFPAFAGWVGRGMAHGAACGNVFSSPAASEICSVARAADNGGGLIFVFGNYAGDLMNFGQAAEELRGQGHDVRVVPITDDIASGPASAPELRRGIAGDLVVTKLAGAAADAGYDLAGVERIARRSNAATRTFGVAFDGCTLPGADRPLFSVRRGRMALGLGIHGEPGLEERFVEAARDVADLLVDRVLAETPPPAREGASLDASGGSRVAVLLNGLGATKYEELFVLYGRIAERLDEVGLVAIAPVVGEQVTSLDMAGVSLTITVLDDEMEGLWTAPVDAPAFRRGHFERAVPVAGRIGPVPVEPAAAPSVVAPGSSESQEVAAVLVRALQIAARSMQQHQDYLGGLDAAAGDGDHGRAMVGGTRAAAEAAGRCLADGGGAATVLTAAADAWAERAGGASGALWAAALRAAAHVVGDTQAVDPAIAARAVTASFEAITGLGHAEVGDKTLVDAAEPLARTLVASVGSGADLLAAWVSGARAASEAATSTAAMSAARGRARTHGERSIGVPDPGAVSLALIATAIGDGLADESRQGRS